METSLNVYDYPDPPEIIEQTATGKINLSFEVIVDVPEEWDKETIIQYIRENIDDLEWYDEEIEDIEVI